MCQPVIVQDGSRKAIIAAFVANLGIASTKLVGFFMTGSSGLLAETIHSLADTGNQGLLLLGAKRASRPPDLDHPFGHGRERYFWSFVVAVVLFTVGGIFALYEGIQKFIHPHSPDNFGVGVTILVAALLLESFSLRTAYIEVQKIKPSTESLHHFMRYSKKAELPVVLLEDIGALFGLVLALAGLIAAHYTHEPRWDAAGSIAIGILLILIASLLAVKMQKLLVGETASDADLELIKKAVQNNPEYRHLIHIRTQHLSEDELLVALKIEFNNDLSVSQLSLQIDHIEAAIRDSLPIAKYIFIEPDIRNATISG